MELKSTHIEQVAARLNWPCVRVNLDSHISRIDLIGKDAIILKDGKQVTEFKEGFYLGLFKIQLHLFLTNMMQVDQMLCSLFKEYWKVRETLRC